MIPSECYPLYYINGSYLGLDCVEKFSKVSGPNACEVKPHSKPWIVSFKGFRGCSGTLISTRIVITAAHCVCTPSELNRAVMLEGAPNCTYWRNNGVPRDGWGTILGDHDRRKITAGEVFIAPDDVIVHKKYRPGREYSNNRYRLI